MGLNSQIGAVWGGFSLLGTEAAGRRLQGRMAILSNKLFSLNFLMLGLEISWSLTDTSKEAATEGLKGFMHYCRETGAGC